MHENRADVIFHPVRIRIVQALFGDRKLTAHQLVEALEGPSIATLYRHLDRLVQAGVVAVVEKRPVRGTLEKVYALAHDQAADIEAEELRQISPEDHKRHFTTLVGSLLNDFERYLGQESLDLGQEGVIIRQEALNVTVEEAHQISGVLKAALAPYMQYPPSASRRRHMLTTILLPVVEATDQQEGQE